MTREKILVYILLPQAAQMVPPFTNELITMIKSSFPLLSVISVYELTRSGQAIISVHFVPFEIYGLLALYYWGLITTISWATRQLERRPSHGKGALDMIDGDRHIGTKGNAGEPLIRLENMTKTFGEHQVLQPINLEILEKETLVVIGASGFGQTTMLRCINHLETPTTGGGT